VGVERIEYRAATEIADDLYKRIGCEEV